MKKWDRLYADILHIYFSPYYRMLSKRELEKVAPESVLKRIKLILKIFYRRLLQFTKPEFSQGDLSKAQGKLWLFAVSKNNKDTLYFIHQSIDYSVFVLDKYRSEFSSSRFVVPNLRFQLLFLYKFVFVWYFFTLKHGRFASRFLPVIFRSVGYYEIWVRLLKRYRPQAIIFANDHNIESRSLLLAANRLKIPTIYLQHASVSGSFPPLKFDLSLLEGNDAYEKYRAIGPVKGCVELVGMPKFDNYLQYRKSRNVIKRVGIPYNLNDDLQIIEELIILLHETFPEKEITIRKHPKDKTGFSFMSRFSFLTESDPLKETAFDFLIQQDCVIAGNSSIHLEATLLNIPAVYFDMGKGTFIEDYYGYVKNGLVVSASRVEDVVSLIYEMNVKNDIFHNAAYYNSTVGTIWEGRSQELVLQHIKNAIKHST